MGARKPYIIATLVENKPGVLFRVSNMFRRRNFNIESITVGPTERKDISRMTIVVGGDEKVVEQVVKQLNKLVEVIKVSILDSENSVSREMALIKVHVANSNARSEIMQYTNIFRGHIVDVSPLSLTIEITGPPDKIDAFIELMRHYGIKEIARTGITALARGSKIVKAE